MNRCGMSGDALHLLLPGTGRFEGADKNNKDYRNAQPLVVFKIVLALSLVPVPAESGALRGTSVGPLVAGIVGR